MDVPHLLSINPSKISHFFSFVAKYISSTLRSCGVLCSITIPFSFCIHCYILFSPPFDGTSTRPSTSLLNVNPSVFFHKISTSHTIFTDTSLIYLPNLLLGKYGHLCHGF